MDPLFNPANEVSVPLGGDVWVVTYGGKGGYTSSNSEDVARVLKRALSITTQPGYASGAIGVYFAKKNNTLPALAAVTGGRFA